MIRNLYDSFFRSAFPKAVEMLGIVYTPIECVDFIIRSADVILRREFGCSISDAGVHVLDPFTGTGTFVTRLLQSGLIRREDLERKYLREIHCNEIVLLAYYVADVNIESVYEDLSGHYLPFDGISLTDTFEQSAHRARPELYPILRGNLESLSRQQKAPVRVIIGNPPYSAGQKSGNDNARNLKYPDLDRRIEETYVASGSSTNKNSLYDSYIRAFRWASDRLRQGGEGGVIGFITNGGWLDGNAAAGMRKCLEKEFSGIYVFQLRGDARTQDELRKKEGGGIFGGGSRAPVVITMLVWNPAREGKARIFYSDIGDYLSREKKLEIIASRRHVDNPEMNWRLIEPDAHGDWLKQRSDLFGNYIVIGDKKDRNNKKTFFEPVYSAGLQTNRDPWVYNFSKKILRENIERTIKFYNEQCERAQEGKEVSLDPRYFSWTDPTKDKAKKGIKFSYDNGTMVVAEYRPFCKTNLFFSRKELNHRPGQWPHIFPTPDAENRVICVTGIGVKTDFSCFMTDKIPDVQLMSNGQCFPLYYYKKRGNIQGQLLGGDAAYERHDGITDWILRTVRSRFGNAPISREDIFYYVYGALHSPEYRTRFSNDLKKELPHIPIAERVDTFLDFSRAGRRLADLHINYEKIPPLPDVEVTGLEKGNFRVEKMRFEGSRGAWDRSGIVFNSDIRVRHIPLAAYDYVVNGRSAIEWIMEEYQISADKASGITDDPNAWAEERGKSRYILDLLLSVINLSVQSQAIVASLPSLDLPDGEGPGA